MSTAAEQRPPKAAPRAKGPSTLAERVFEMPPDVWLVVAITAIAALLRFATITTQSFWIDEATTVHEVGLSLGGMLHEVRINETTPPLYFLLAWVWAHIFGAGELGIRSLSALAGIATVPVAYLCGRELVSRSAGVVTAALVAVSPFMIWYSQEARSYALFGLLTALSLLFWARALRSNGSRDIGWWAGCSVLAVLTHFFAGFLVGPEAVWLLWRLRSRAVLIAVVVVGVAQLAVLPLALGDTSHPLSWITAFPLSIRVDQIPVTLGLSELYKSPGVTWGLPGAAIVLAAIVGLLWWAGGRRERRGGLVAGILAGCVILIPFLLVLVGHDYIFARNFMPAFVPLAILVAAACTGPRARVPGAIAAVVVLGAFVWGGVKIDGDPAYQRPNWRGVAMALGAVRVSRAIIAYDGNTAEQPLAVYLPGTQFSYSGNPAATPVTSVSEVDVVGSVEQTVPAKLPPGVRVVSQTAVDEFLVVRFSVSPAWRLGPAAIAARAQLLLGPAGGKNPSVLIQH